MSIPISEQHGVNPAVPLCYYCLEPKNEVVLAGRLPGDAEAPQHHVWDMSPCNKCQDHMDAGIIIISIRDGESDRMADEQLQHRAMQAHASNPAPFVPNPYRTGGFWVLKAEAFERIMKQICNVPETVDQMLKQRWCFLDDQVCEMIGLPREQEGEDDAGEPASE